AVAGLDIFDRLRIDTVRGEHRVADRLPAGAAERDRLALEAIEALRRVALAEGEVEHVVGAHFPGGNELHSLRQAEREHAWGGEAQVRLVLIDQLDAGGCLERT